MSYCFLQDGCLVSCIQTGAHVTHREDWYPIIYIQHVDCQQGLHRLWILGIVLLSEYTSQYISESVCINHSRILGALPTCTYGNIKLPQMNA